MKFEWNKHEIDIDAAAVEPAAAGFAAVFAAASIAAIVVAIAKTVVKTRTAAEAAATPAAAAPVQSSFSFMLVSCWTTMLIFLAGGNYQSRNPAAQHPKKKVNHERMSLWPKPQSKAGT